MSDLCYNCCVCHLPEPCKQDLFQCEICYAWGHQFIFCPRGVKHRDPNYKYWGLCHNCDIWHLPEPCRYIFHTCEKCGHAGHMEFFCPINATDRVAYLREKRIKEEADSPTQPPTNHVVMKDMDCMSHATITKIKLDAVHQAFSMLDQQYTPDQVIDFMGGPNGPHRALNTAPTNDRITEVGQGHTASVLQPLQQLQDAHVAATTSLPPLTQMLQAHHNGLKCETTPGTYSTMQQRFDQGDLARTVEQERPLYFESRVGIPPPAQVMPLSQEFAPTMTSATPNMQDAALQMLVPAALPGDQAAQVKPLLQVYTPTTRGNTLNTADAVLQTSLAGAQPTTHITPNMQVVASSIQDGALQVPAVDAPSTAQATPPTMEAASKMQIVSPEGQATVSQSQNIVSSTEAIAHAQQTENTEETGMAELLQTGKKKKSTKTSREATPTGAAVKQGPRCASCVKAHKRCAHRTQGSPTALPSFDPSYLNTPSTASNYLPSSGVPEGYVPAPPTMPETSFPLPTASVDVPTQATGKKATTKRKR